MVQIEPIPRQSLVETVLQRLRGVIVDGQFRSGDRLPGELELVDMLGVSRPVLREALSRLEGLGVIEVVRGRGTYVAQASGPASCAKLVASAIDITSRDLVQFVEFRAALEIHAARLAAENATEAQLDELDRACTAIDLPGRSYEEEVRADFEFHRLIATIGGCSIIVNSLDVVQAYVLVGLLTTTPNPRNHANSRVLHQRIVEGIRSRDPARAGEAMLLHMEAVRRSLRQRIDSAGRDETFRGDPLAPPDPDDLSPHRTELDASRPHDSRAEVGT